MALQFPIFAADSQRRGLQQNFPARPLSEIIGNGFFTVDHRWTVKYWNKAAAELLKVDAADIVGKNLWEEFVGAFPVEFYRFYHKAFQLESPVHFKEYWGEMGAWCDVVAYCSNDTLSVSFKMNNVPVDKHQPERELKILHEFYRFVTDVTNHCLWEWDLGAKEQFWIDGGHKKLFGFAVENSLIPQSFWESCVHPEDLQRLLSKLQGLGDTTMTTWDEQYRFKKADGEYAYVHDHGKLVYGDDGQVSRIIGATQDITEKILSDQKLLMDTVLRQRAIRDAMLTAQENERGDIGKKLQNDLGQILALTKMYMLMVKSQGKKGKMYLAKSSDFIVNIIDEIRKISKALTPPGVIIGLTDSIKNFLEDLVGGNSLKIEFLQDDMNDEVLEEKLQLSIFRIIQEQLGNIVKHAAATEASVHLRRKPNFLELLISDNGIGHDLSRVQNGVGIINIKSRVEMHDGNVQIISLPGQGYQMKVEFPLPKTV